MKALLCVQIKSHTCRVCIPIVLCKVKVAGFPCLVSCVFDSLLSLF